MIKTNTQISAAAQTLIVMPTYTLGGVKCARIDVPARKRFVDASFTGATPGIPVWSPPPR